MLLVVRVSSKSDIATGSEQWGHRPPRPTRVGLVAVVAPLLAVVAGVAGWAGVDRDVTASDPLRDNGFGDFDCGGVTAGPRSLAAGLGAVAAAAYLRERGPAHWTKQLGLLACRCCWRGCRRSIVVPRGFSHGGLLPLAGFGCGRGGRVAGRSLR